jgi:L-fuconolactonase
MQIIDAQVHEIGPDLEWADDTEARYDLLTEILLAGMDAVGVDAAVIVPIDEPYGHDAVAKRPGRFAGAYAIRTPDAPDIDEQVERLRSEPGSVGLRVSFGRLSTDPTGEKGEARFRAGVFDGLFAACEQRGMPLFCSSYGQCRLVGEVAARHPELTLIVDHIGIAQPPMNVRDTPPWRQLDDVLGIAHYENVAVKLCGAPVLSDEAYPYRDNDAQLTRLLEAFGPERLMWASDIGRFTGRLGWENRSGPPGRGPYPGKHTYAEALFFIRESGLLSDGEKELILGGALKRLLNWSPPAP